MKRIGIDFIGKRSQAFILSAVLILAAIASLFYQGLKLGIDFTGGVLIELEYEQIPDLQDIREQLTQAEFSDVTVQNFGTSTDVIIRFAPQKASSAALSAKVIRVLGDKTNTIQIRRIEYVGPKVGEELTTDGALAVLYALIGILVYVAFRFEYRFSIGSIAALIHDVIITLGVFSLLQLEFDLSVLAAILAVIGYSLNDTIVVFDRIRENFRLSREQEKPTSVINNALNQTLARTLTTSSTTLFVLLALFFFGGEIIRGFASALLIGVIVGTYSSIYVASAILVIMGTSKTDLMPSEKEQKEINTRP